MLLRPITYLPKFLFILCPYQYQPIVPSKFAFVLLNFYSLFLSYLIRAVDDHSEQILLMDLKNRCLNNDQIFFDFVIIADRYFRDKDGY